MQTFCWMILGMINQQDVQHHKLIHNFKNSSTLKSKLERVRRFFAHTEIDPIHFEKILTGSVWNSIPKIALR